MEAFSVYIHIPFCFHKCPYCDFNTYAVSVAPETEYVEALLAELDYYSAKSDWRDRTVHSIYFGGGTPSIFSPESIKRITNTIKRTFPSDIEMEVSLEANPGTVTIESLEGYYQAGINRLSIGAQSFNPKLLRFLGRIHSVTQTEAAVSAARDVGFSNLSLDLMFGLGDQTEHDLRRDLLQLIQLRPDHVSIYCLTIEKGTEFYNRWRKGSLPFPKEDTIVEMIDQIDATLSKEGITRYEISNFARSGKEAQHNLAYWSGRDYLGLGAGAHSFLKARDGFSAKRWSNCAKPTEFIERATSNGHADSWRDFLLLHDLMFEFFFLGLRKTVGVSTVDFEERFDVSIAETYPGLVEALVDERFLISDNSTIRLSPKGVLLADSIVENFVHDGKNLPQRQGSSAGDNLGVLRVA